MRKGLPRLSVPGTLLLISVSLTAGCRSTSIASRLLGRDQATVQTAQIPAKKADLEPTPAHGIELAAPVQIGEIETVAAESTEVSHLATEDPFADEPAADVIAAKPADVDQEEQRYLTLLEQDPDRAATWNDLGAYYMSQQYWEASADALEKAVALEPERSLYRNNLAIALVRAGHVADGLSEFTHSVGAAAAHYNVGYLLMQDGKELEAARQFLLAVMKDPDLQEASYWLNVLADKGVFAPPATALPQEADQLGDERAASGDSKPAETAQSD